MTEKEKLSEESKIIPGPSGGGDMVVGAVGEIHGKDGVLTDFKPTRFELKKIAKWYLKRAKEIEILSRVHGQSGSYEARMRPFALARVDRIEKHIGEEAIDEIRERIDQEFERKEGGE